MILYFVSNVFLQTLSYSYLLSKRSFTSINSTCKLAARIGPQGYLLGFKQIAEFGGQARHGAKRTKHVASTKLDRTTLAVVGKPRRGREAAWPAGMMYGPPEVQASTQPECSVEMEEARRELCVMI